MAKSITKKLQAQKLRKQGLSISEIAEKLDMRRSGTISMWCRDISLTPRQIERLIKKQKSGSAKGAQKLKQKRLEEVKMLKERGLREIGEINGRDLFIAGLAIYWSEGYTYEGGDQVGFTNSDPKMILLMLEWFEKICEVSKERFKLAVRINQNHKHKTREVESYWSNLTGIPLSQFNKTVLIKSKSKKVYPNSKNYFGTPRITIRRSSHLRRKINGWIGGLAKRSEPT